MQRRHSRSWCSSRMFWSRIWELPGKTATTCVIDLWRFVYPGVYGAKYSTKAPNDADLLKWLADDGFSDGSSPCHWWLDGYLLGSRQHVQWPTVVEWPSH